MLSEIAVVKRSNGQKGYVYNGELVTLKEIVKLSGSSVAYKTVLARLKKGVPLEEALTKPTRDRTIAKKVYIYGGYRADLKTLIELTESKVNYKTAIRRLKRGWSIDDVMNPKLQGRKRLNNKHSYKGYVGSIKDIVKESGTTKTYKTVLRRLRQGYTLEEALTLPNLQGGKVYRKYTYKGYTGLLSDIVERFSQDLTVQLVRHRLNEGYTLEEALTYKKGYRRGTKLYEYNGYKRSLRDIIKETGCGLTYEAVKMRLDKGATLEEALEPKKEYEYKGYKGSLKYVWEHSGTDFCLNTIRGRLKMGYTIDEAFTLSRDYEYKGYKGNLTYIIEKTGVDIHERTVRERMNKGYSLEDALTMPKKRRNK